MRTIDRRLGVTLCRNYLEPLQVGAGRIRTVSAALKLPTAVWRYLGYAEWAATAVRDESGLPVDRYGDRGLAGELYARAGAALRRRGAGRATGERSKSVVGLFGDMDWTIALYARLTPDDLLQGVLAKSRCLYLERSL